MRHGGRGDEAVSGVAVQTIKFGCERSQFRRLAAILCALAQKLQA